MSPASSIEIVFKVQYANVSAKDSDIYLAFRFKLACLASPPHHSLWGYSRNLDRQFFINLVKP